MTNHLSATPPRTQAPARARRAGTASLSALALGAFAVGITEVVIAGLLPEVATDFGVSLPTAGLLVSGYALGMVVGAPLLTVLGANVPRKQVLLWLVALFMAAGLLSALAPGYEVLLTGRVLSALAGGAYVGTAAVRQARAVPRPRFGPLGEWDRVGAGVVHPGRTYTARRRGDPGGRWNARCAVARTFHAHPAA
ncbi:MFS transporter [Streptomyces sp. NPDC048473]|uniref:MFS transporter n=1 Tax=unclassified Streptomyces TaxID=2593676 RepID=UPI003712051D